MYCRFVEVSGCDESSTSSCRQMELVITVRNKLTFWCSPFQITRTIKSSDNRWMNVFNSSPRVLHFPF